MLTAKLRSHDATENRSYDSGTPAVLRPQMVLADIKRRLQACGGVRRSRVGRGTGPFDVRDNSQVKKYHRMPVDLCRGGGRRVSLRMIRGFLVLCLCVAAVAPGRVCAQEADYRELVRQAVEEYRAGRFEEASAFFKQAHAIRPSARTHRGLGLTYFEARRYALAIPHLRGALTDIRRPLTPAQREVVERALEQAEAVVARFEVTLDPPGATLQLDGSKTTLVEGELLLDPGKHELVCTAAGYQSARRILDAQSGASSSLVIELKREQEVTQTEGPEENLAAQPATGGTSSEAASAADDEGGTGIGPFVVMGAGGVLLIGAGVTGLLASGVHSDLEKDCPDGACTDPNWQDDRDTGKALVVATNILLAGGLVTVAAGITYWLLTSESKQETQVAAGCTFDGCGAAIAQRF